MALPSNTFHTYDMKGIREDLSDVIYRIDPTKCPLTSNIGRAKASQRIHEWQTQALASASDANEVLEGDDATTDAATATVRPNNRTQISDKVARVTGTGRSVDTAGRDDEMEYQVLLKGLELKRDVEKQMLSNKASAAGASGTASRSASFESWLTSNVSHGGTGATTGFSATTGLVAAPTDGTTRTFTETLLKTVMASCFDNGANPTILMLSGGQKQTFSGFTGIATNRYNVKGEEQGVVIGAADVYVSDFGKLNVVPNQFSRTRTALLIDPEYAKLATLRPMKNWPLAKTGDSDQRQVLIEYTLEMCNQAAHGKVADLA
jgi:hypothetical protein